MYGENESLHVISLALEECGSRGVEAKCSRNLRLKILEHVLSLPLCNLLNRIRLKCCETSCNHLCCHVAESLFLSGGMCGLVYLLCIQEVLRKSPIGRVLEEAIPLPPLVYALFQR